MADYCINFSYSSPADDIQTVTGINADGSVNIKFTLLALKKLLLENVAMIDELVENADDIKDMTSVAYGCVGIKTDCVEKLLQKNLIREVGSESDDDLNMSELRFLDDVETNYSKYSAVKNVTNIKKIVDDEDESDMSSDDEKDDNAITDDNNMGKILTKYNTDFILNLYSDSETEQD